MSPRADPAAAIMAADQHRERLDLLLDEWRDSLANGSQGTRREPEQVLRDIAALTADLADTVRCFSQQIRLSIEQLRAERCRDCGVAQGDCTSQTVSRSAAPPAADRLSCACIARVGACRSSLGPMSARAAGNSVPRCSTCPATSGATTSSRRSARRSSASPALPRSLA